MPSGGSPPRFCHGVASGDPEASGVVIWTRVTAGAPDPLLVRWRLGLDPSLVEVVAEGAEEATAVHDFTVKVAVGDLEPSTTYFYGFESGGRRSPVGRTRTAPSGTTSGIRIGVVSCAAWTQGFFNAYGRLAERDVDLVVHLGDYIYETGDAWKEAGRAHSPPRRLRTLSDYRARHAQYRTDTDLQRLHQQHPMVAVWDDHDVAGNAWKDGAADHDPEEDGDWDDRRAAAVQAYLEWLPVRVPNPAEPERIYRTVRLGDLAELIVLDTRLAGRERPAQAGNRAVATVLVRDRSLLGDEQRAWLEGELRSPTQWRLLANQVMMAPLRLVKVPRPLRRLVPGLVAGGAGVNAGQWDGYPDERRSLFEYLRGEGLGNVVVLTGDLHSSWAGELTLDHEGSEETPVGVEFVTPSVTSQAFADSVAPRVPGSRALLRLLIARHNRHQRFFDLEGHGYVIVDVSTDRVQADWWHVNTVAHRAHVERLVASWMVGDGESRLSSAPGPLPLRAGTRPPRP